jgi:hypothetical protein
MRSLTYYVKAIELCQAMEKAGLASLKMPEHNIFLSSKIPPQELDLAQEAVDVYVRLHRLMARCTRGLQWVSVSAIAWMLYQALA